MAQVLIKSGLLIRFEEENDREAQVIRTQERGKMSEQEIEFERRVQPNVSFKISTIISCECFYLIIMMITVMVCRKFR